MYTRNCDSPGQKDKENITSVLRQCPPHAGNVNATNGRVISPTELHCFVFEQAQLPHAEATNTRTRISARNYITRAADGTNTSA